MNFITTNHRGGLSNVMFKLASSISLALDNEVEYIFSNEFLRPIDRIVTKGEPDYRRFYDENFTGDYDHDRYLFLKNYINQ
jgi:hypothetical protein